MQGTISVLRDTLKPSSVKQPKGLRPRRRTYTIKTLFRRYAPTAALGGVISTLLYLSLNHLARGIELITLCDRNDAMQMAVGLDLLIVSLECSLVSTAGNKSHKQVAKFANPALIAAFTWSAGLNGYAYSVAQDDGWMKIVAAALGSCIPALIYLGVRTWAIMAIASSKADK